MSKTAVNAGWSVVGLYERPGAIRLLIHPFASRTASGSGGETMSGLMSRRPATDSAVAKNHASYRHFCSDSAKEHR